MNEKKIAILCGGKSSSERDVSLRSGDAVYDALKNIYPTELFRLDEDALPDQINPKFDVIFPLVHGEFGEDGRLQRLLEENHFAYCGSDSASSALCMNKWRSKQIAIQNNISVPKSLRWNDQRFEELWEYFQGAFIVKPNAKGSSIGVRKIYSEADFDSYKAQLEQDQWIVESCINGREITVGVLNKDALPSIEIRAKNGFYDYQHKYTAGMTDYMVPAPISANLQNSLKEISEKMFQCCGCRDFARLDFLLDEKNVLYFLEINTSPGMTSTSLLPKAAAKIGISFPQLCVRMVEPAFERFSPNGEQPVKFAISLDPRYVAK